MVAFLSIISCKAVTLRAPQRASRLDCPQQSPALFGWSYVFVIFIGATAYRSQLSRAIPPITADEWASRLRLVTPCLRT